MVRYSATLNPEQEGFDAALLIEVAKEVITQTAPMAGLFGLGRFICCLNFGDQQPVFEGGYSGGDFEVDFEGVVVGVFDGAGVFAGFEAID